MPKRGEPAKANHPWYRRIPVMKRLIVIIGESPNHCEEKIGMYCSLCNRVYVIRSEYKHKCGVSELSGKVASVVGERFGDGNRRGSKAKNH